MVADSMAQPTPTKQRAQSGIAIAATLRERLAPMLVEADNNVLGLHDGSR